MIQVSHVTKKFRSKIVLDDVSMCCHQGYMGFSGRMEPGRRR